MLNPPSILHAAPSPPSYFIQTCPICQGQKAFQSRLTLVWTDCDFCWGVGAVKVNWWSGKVETVDPPAEPWGHQQKRQALEHAAERRDDGSER